MQASFESRLADTLARLERLERWEWWRWTTVLIISLALTLALFSLSNRNLRPDEASANLLDQALWGLLGLVLLFDIYAFYQQLRISKLRRQLANEIGMLSTLEALRPPNAVEEIQRSNRRRAPRFYLDQRLKVSFHEGQNGRTIYGRTRDICQGGLGGVIADPVEPGTRVELEFPVPVQDPPLKMTATVSFRRGFHHGFEFSVRDANDIAVIKKVCAQTALVQ